MAIATARESELCRVSVAQKQLAAGGCGDRSRLVCLCGHASLRQPRKSLNMFTASTARLRQRSAILTRFSAQTSRPEGRAILCFGGHARLPQPRKSLNMFTGANSPSPVRFPALFWLTCFSALRQTSGQTAARFVFGRHALMSKSRKSLNMFAAPASRFRQHSSILCFSFDQHTSCPLPPKRRAISFFGRYALMPTSRKSLNMFTEPAARFRPSENAGFHALF